jgi:hypothetical protein
LHDWLNGKYLGTKSERVQGTIGVHNFAILLTAQTKDRLQQSSLKNANINKGLFSLR